MQRGPCEKDKPRLSNEPHTLRVAPLDMLQPAKVELDGAFGEGGGQILRTSLALSLITGRPFHLRNVRARRPKPGLQPQHLMSVRAAATIGQASLRGASKGSTDLEFAPGAVVPDAYRFAIGTAGATSLVLHTIYLPLVLAGGKSEVTIEGGTHVSHSPCYHFLQTTWRGYLDLMGVDMRLNMGRPGFYPRGGGLLEAGIEPCSRLKGLGDFGVAAGTSVRGFSAVAGLPEQIASRQAQRAARKLQPLGIKADIKQETWSGGPSTVLGLILNTTPVAASFFGLGERGKPVERIADETVSELSRYWKAAPAVDKHSADQILLPLSLAEGPSTFPVEEITSHLLTNTATIQRFIDRSIQVEGNEGDPGLVRIV